MIHLPIIYCVSAIWKITVGSQYMIVEWLVLLFIIFTTSILVKKSILMLGDDLMKKVFIAHEYGDESHFKALYSQAENKGYKVSGQIILKNRSFLGKIYKAIVKNHSLIQAGNIIFERIRFSFIKNEILIVGIAPYNTEMNKYRKIFKRNRSFYFTSQTVWDGSDYISGTYANKKEFEKILTECFQGAFCVTEKSKNEVSKYVQNSTVVNHSIETKEYTKNTSCGRKINFLYIGQYVDRKNISLILNWFKQNSIDNITVTFIGKGPLEKLINKQSLEDGRIFNRGFCDKNFLKENISNYDFLILPSDKEPFGIVLIEALACGVPCIVSNADGPSEIIKNGYNGFIFDLNNKEKNFADAMNLVLNLSIGERTRLKENAIQSSKQYDTGNIINRWIDMLEN